MSSPQSSPQQAPEYALHREVSSADDLAAQSIRKHGMNMAGYESAHIQVIPTPDSDADPTAVVLWWSEAAGKFIQEHTSISKAGVGANTPYEFTVDCKGRIMFVGLNPMAEGSAKIYVSGFNRVHPD